MKRRIRALTRGSVFTLGRRAFLTGGVMGGLVGGLTVGLGLVIARGRRDGSGPPGRARTADPWATLREDVVTPDELEPSGDDLAG